MKKVIVLLILILIGSALFPVPVKAAASRDGVVVWTVAESYMRDPNF